MKCITINRFILVFLGLLNLIGCSNQKEQIDKSLNGEWRLINPKISQEKAVNIALDGVRFFSDSLEFFSDYMSNPIFNQRSFSISKDSITIEFKNGVSTFAFFYRNDTLYIKDSSYVYVYEKLQGQIHNKVNKIKFESFNPGWNKRYFFELVIHENGTFRYDSKSENRVLEGHLKEKYTAFIFEKLHNIDLPIQINSNEIIPNGDHIFKMELFTDAIRVDSVTYSREILGSYSRWLASILQSTPLWIDDALFKN